VAQAPYAEIDGDRLVIHNFRNFDYMSKTDFQPRWETKTVHLDFFTNLTTGDQRLSAGLVELNLALRVPLTATTTS
jgi:hypothetical protein